VSEPAVDQVERALLRVVRRANAPRTHDRFVARSGINLERASYVLLVRLGESGPLRLGELADLVGVDASTASRQVKVLFDRGLVERVPDSGDRRCVVLGITDAGEEVLQRGRASRHESITELVDGWSDRDVQSLGRLLERLADAFEAQD
jgi:DNA-binding MarR family transcriptional regulator